MQWNRMLNCIFQDWAANSISWTARFLLVQFRFLSSLTKTRLGRFFSLPLWVFYKFYSQFLLNIELSPRTSVGVGICLPHPYNIVINSGVIIGGNCVIRHGVTIGIRGGAALGQTHANPIIGDGVDIGCSAIILGNVKIGDRAVIGAGSVVLSDVESDSLYCGSKATRIR